MVDNSEKRIQDVISGGESKHIEFKESFKKDVIETVAAFANTEGGSIFVGVRNDGSIRGIDVTDEILKEWINRIKQSTQPQLFPSFKVFKLESKDVLEIKVKEYSLKPVSCRGKYIKRIGASNHFLSSDEIVEMRLQSTNSSYDTILLDDGVDEIDNDLISLFYNTIKNRGKTTVANDEINTLKKLGFIKNEKITLAALLLFGNHKTNIHVGRFKTATHIIDDRVIRTPLISAVNEVMEFIKKNISLGYEFKGDLQRVEKWEYPLPAIREILLNAVVHKDYSNPNDVIIKIFDDRIVIVNPGRFLGHLTSESVMTDDYSPIHRNKLLAEAFYLLGDIEKYGTGFIRIREHIKNYAGMRLEIEDVDGFMRVTILKNTEKKLLPDGGISGGISGGIKDLLIYINDNPGKRTNEIAETMNIPSKTIEKWIAKLRTKDLIEFRGSKKTGGYWVKTTNGDK